jgi:predicted transcriptional regulator
MELDVDPEDLSSYTLEELKQLLAINKQTLDYYLKMLEDKDGKLNEDNRRAIEMCKLQIQTDITSIEVELKKKIKEEE